MPVKIAVAIPCHNEAETIAQVVGDFRHELPEAEVIVFDNLSKDNSIEEARKAGASIFRVTRKGKGNVQRCIFDFVDADVIVIVDGDGTYAAHDVHQLIDPILRKEADMVVGNRLRKADRQALFFLRRFGNRLIVGAVNMIFGTAFEDILSGYRAFSKYFVSNIPLLTEGFETETELTLQALEARMEIREVLVSYKPRPGESQSKLRPFRDGVRILLAIAMLLRDHQPLRIYGFLGMLFLFLAGVAVLISDKAAPSVMVSEEGFSSGVILLTIVGVFLIGSGFVLSAINTRFRELKQIVYRSKRREAGGGE